MAAGQAVTQGIAAGAAASSVAGLAKDDEDDESKDPIAPFTPDGEEMEPGEAAVTAIKIMQSFDTYVYQVTHEFPLELRLSRRWNELEMEYHSLEDNWTAQRGTTVEQLQHYFRIVREKYMIGRLFFLGGLFREDQPHYSEYMNAWGLFIDEMRPMFDLFSLDPVLPETYLGHSLDVK